MTRIYQSISNAKKNFSNGIWAETLRFTMWAALPCLDWGKNVVDIQLLVSTKRGIERIIRKLEMIGYVHKEAGGDKHRIFFNRNRFHGRKKVHVHLHLMWKSAKKNLPYLMSRDYLRTHPEEARKYFTLKRLWARKAGSRAEDYTEMKTDYVRDVLRKARKELKLQKPQT